MKGVKTPRLEEERIGQKGFPFAQINPENYVPYFIPDQGGGTPG